MGITINPTLRGGSLKHEKAVIGRVAAVTHFSPLRGLRDE